MKLLYVSGLILLTFVISGRQGVTADESTTAAAATAATSSSTTAPGDGATTKSSTTATVTEKSTTSAGATDAPKGTTKASTDTETKDPLKGVTEKCKTAVEACFKSEEKLKDKSITSVTCDIFQGAKSCFTGGDKCTEANYTSMKDVICFCPRTSASLLLVAILCVLSKLMTQH